MNLVVLVIIVLLTCSAPDGRADKQVVVSRKKRYLMFPQGSNLVLTVANPKRLLTNMRPKGWNSLLEVDVFFPLPEDTRVLHQSWPHRRRTDLYQRDRRQLYDAVQDVLHMHDLDGRACLARIMCEASELPGSEGSFLHEVLRTIFTSPGDHGLASLEASARVSECAEATDKCRVSILDALLAWAP